VEKLSGKDAGKDAGGGAAVEHTNFAARDCDTHFFFFLKKKSHLRQTIGKSVKLRAQC
jgi:hypothetical protein